MNFLKKMLNDPERGPRSNSPLLRAAIGLGLLFFDLHIIFTDSIRIGKAGNGTYIHFADHPKTLIFTCIWVTLGAVWALRSARYRYLMHGE